MESMLARRFLPPFAALVAFEAAARHGSFTKAADELDLTQGAISRQVKLLEDQLGLALFVRVRQRVALTDAGAFYAGEIRQILQKFVSATANVIAYRGRGGLLSIATLPTFGTRWLVPRIGRFIARHPQVEISFSTRVRPFDFATEPVDAAIHFGAEDWPGTTMHRLMGETLVVAASPAFIRQHAVERPGDLARLPLLVQATRPTAWEDYAQLAQIPDLAGPRLHFEQFALVLQAAVASIGVALVPHFLVRPELEAGSLDVLFDVRLETEKGYYLVYPEGRDRLPALADFRDWLIEVAGSEALPGPPSLTAEAPTA
ncbi:transcriptional regulator GcvA [Kaistia dalseonensis]|uniref:LysR family glycine cleavage system transcriptional activator n=1 Tax=Kaistia dalseonensis TaxID=410840 RepID=A0ABU0H2Q0_9HYPH|nr:transcriptional regulator GcvA [Kaistia dalseonensis]MCX5494001.1 transcriptional regulator GcvA [Kaistia dalseonensis]MDQ0436578.1 LysR family glycine cleavage system transcriptional activator [Kaistia dalseonensis]